MKTYISFWAAMVITNIWLASPKDGSLWAATAWLIFSVVLLLLFIRERSTAANEQSKEKP